MEQTKALNALEPWLALSKSANSSPSAANLIMQAIAAPNTFVFAELLQTPNVQKLRDSDHKSHLELLEIFAWGSWKDYAEKKTMLPALSVPQVTKLKLLSLLPLSSSHSSLTYTSLQSALELDSPRALESLVTEAIYSGLVTSTLDPRKQQVNISAVAPLRDLAPGSIPALSATLAAWGARCEEALRNLEVQAEAVRQQARSREEKRALRETQVKAAVQKEEAKNAGDRSKSGLGSDLGGQEGDDAMDLDDTENSYATRGSKASKRNMLGVIGGGKRLG